MIYYALGFLCFNFGHDLKVSQCRTSTSLTYSLHETHVILCLLEGCTCSGRRRFLWAATGAVLQSYSTVLELLQWYSCAQKHIVHVFTPRPLKRNQA